MDCLQNTTTRFVGVLPPIFKNTARLLNSVGWQPFMADPKNLKMMIIGLFGSHQKYAIFLRRSLQVSILKNRQTIKNNSPIIKKATKPLQKLQGKKLSCTHNYVKSTVAKLCHFCIFKIMTFFMTPLFAACPPLAPLVSHNLNN